MTFNMDFTGSEELMAALQTLDPEVIEAAGLALGVLYIVIVASLVYFVARYLLRALGLCTMYRKAGVAPWKAFIPFYNVYNNYKISWNSKMFFLYAALGIASAALGFVTEGALSLLSSAASLGVIVMAVMQNMKMSNRFGKGTGTGIALILFPGITSLILGLGKAEYQAEVKEQAAAEIQVEAEPQAEAEPQVEAEVQAEPENETEPQENN